MERNRINAIAAYAATQHGAWSNHLASLTRELVEDIEARKEHLATLQGNLRFLEAIQEIRAAFPDAHDDASGNALAGLLASLLQGLKPEEANEIITVLEAEQVHRMKWEKALLDNPHTLEFLRESINLGAAEDGQD